MSSQKIKLCGLSFRGANWAAIEASSDPIKFLITVNSDFIVRAQTDSQFRALILSQISTFDGQIPYFLARIFNFKRRHEIEKISGSDLILSLIQKSGRLKERVFLLGASEESNRLAVQRAVNEFHADIRGYAPPLVADLRDELNADIIRQLTEFKPTYLFVGLGAPKQEKWIHAHLGYLQTIGVKYVIGCGGAIDFFSGKAIRAPVFIQKAGLEGIYRLIRQPALFRLVRIFRSSLVFLYLFRSDFS